MLGAAGASFSIRNFNGVAAAGFPGGNPDTNYHVALADKRAGVDLLTVFGLTPDTPEIVAQFSSDFDFYLGLDNNHGTKNDLVVVLLHEFGHGLGFSSFMSRTTGNTPAGLTDPFLNNVLDGSTNTPLSALLASTPADRLAVIQKVDQIVWTGSNVAAAVPSTLLFGRPELDAPTIPGIDGSRYGTASFGPLIPATGITGSVVLAQDGVGVSTDACEPLTAASAAAVHGKIALVDRGACTFVVKVKNAQDAGAVAVMVADNTAANPPGGLGGADPTITISSVLVRQTTGNAIKTALASGPVTVTIGRNQARRAGTDLQERPQLYASTPIAPGSTLNHWDPIAFRNLLMEPAINGDLTHNLIPPFDMTLAEMHDMGWFTDANLDGKEDATVILNGCDTRVANEFIGNGALLADQARAWFGQCAATTSTAKSFERCVDDLAKAAHANGIITGKQSSHVRQCAQAKGNNKGS
ncbi:MAG TPA: PA domain-containing protein [Vicinamibacterales bacterium]|nr:PA domain-containing protein [Vicinamibacterales bacterium]